MGVNVQAMMETANNKFNTLVDIVSQLKNGSKVDFDKMFNLIHSIHNDEVELIIKMNEIENAKNEKPKKEIQIINFMVR